MTDLRLVNRCFELLKKAREVTRKPPLLIFKSSLSLRTRDSMTVYFWRAPELGVESAVLNVNGFQYLFRIW